MDKIRTITVLLLAIPSLLMACTPSPPASVLAPESPSPEETQVQAEETAEPPTTVLPSTEPPEPTDEAATSTTESAVEEETPQKPSVEQPQFIAKLASLAGFEPTTRCLEGSRSVQLSYRDN